MIYPVHWNGVRLCRIAYTLGDVGARNVGTRGSDTWTTSRPKGSATAAGSAETFAQIMERRQQEAREREQQAKTWSAEVTEQLMNERSKFLEDFDEEQRRVFGFLPPR